jgi:formiminotetrahydrofolate cyclodeaminase
LSELDMQGALSALGAADSPSAGGSAAALVGAIAAAVVVKVARRSDDPGLAAQGAALGTRLADLAPSDAEALAAARAALAASTGGGDERRDFQLGQVLDLASAIPLEIAEACADVAALAAQLSETAEDDSRPDAAVAAILAAAAAQAAVRLVEVNLAVGSDDARVTRARAAARSAADAAHLLPS